MPHSNNKGSAIIIVLIISIIAMSLTLFAVDVSKKIVNSSEMLIDKLYAKFGVESEIEKLKFYVSTGRFYSSYVKNNYIPSGFPKTLYIDGRKQTVDNSTLYIQDTGGLINVWFLNKNLICSLLKKKGIEQSEINIIYNSLEDWYDRDDLKRFGGAESEYYKSKGCKYTPRNFNGVQSIYEWHIVRGLMDNKTFDFIKKYLVLSPNWRANINTMDLSMLSAIFDISTSTAKIILGLKNVKGSLTLNDVVRLIGKNMNSNTFEYGDYPTFVLDIDAKFKFNMSMERVFCTISFNPDNTTPYRILKWQN